MRRSKLEISVDILNVLARKGPLSLTHVMYKANVNCNVLKNYLALLIKQGLVEERSILGERAVFVVTEHGIIVLNNFRNLTQALPDLECIQSQN